MYVSDGGDCSYMDLDSADVDELRWTVDVNIYLTLSNLTIATV